MKIKMLILILPSFANFHRIWTFVLKVFSATTRFRIIKILCKCLVLQVVLLALVLRAGFGFWLLHVLAFTYFSLKVLQTLMATPGGM